MVDEGVKTILQKRLDRFNGKPKEAFANLEDNPIWLNEEKGIKIKRVTISGVSNATSLHEAKDLNGSKISRESDDLIETDFVTLGNNHAVAIYEDEEGNLSEEVVSFFDAVTKRINGLPVINEVNESGHKLKFTMKQNEMFLIPSDDFNPLSFDLKDSKNNTIISEHLFRVQAISSKDYWFRHHLETELLNEKLLNGKTFNRLRSPKNLTDLFKVRINHLGQIVQTGEY